MLIGATVGYAPPEQYEAGNPRVSARTDVFSLAAIAHELFAGRPAFPVAPKEGALRVLARMMTGPPPSILSDARLPPELAARPDLAAAIDVALVRALDPEPSARYASVEELFAALEPSMRAALSVSIAATGEVAPSGEEETVPGNMPLPTLEEMLKKRGR